MNVSLQETYRYPENIEIIRRFRKEEEFLYTAVQGYQWMNYSIKQNISVGQGFAFNSMV